MSAMTSHITSLTTVYSTVYSRRRSKKTSKLRVTGLCEGNSPVPGEFPAKGVSIWWPHHEELHPLLISGDIHTTNAFLRDPIYLSQHHHIHKTPHITHINITLHCCYIYWFKCHINKRVALKAYYRRISQNIEAAWERFSVFRPLWNLRAPPKRLSNFRSIDPFNTQSHHFETAEHVRMRRYHFNW